MLKLTVLGDGRWRRLQHLLRKVNKDLVELATTQQVEVLDDLQENTYICQHLLLFFVLYNL